MGHSHKREPVAAGSKTISASYRLDAPRWVWLAVISSVPKPFPRAAAMLSLRLDLDAGAEKSIRDYSRIWGWTRYAVESNLADMRAEVSIWIQQRQDAADSQTDIRQSSDTSQTKTDQNTQENNDSQTGAGQSSDTSQTPTITGTTGEDKGAESRVRVCDWPEELASVWKQFFDWRGEEPGADLRKTVELLMMPKGHPAGCRLQREYPNRTFNGYTIDEVLDGIEAWAMAKHHSPAVLVKHVAGLIDSPQQKGTTNGTAHSTATGKPPASSYERRLGLTRTKVEESRRKLFSTVEIGPDGIVDRGADPGASPAGPIAFGGPG